MVIEPPAPKAVFPRLTCALCGASQSYGHIGSTASRLESSRFTILTTNRRVKWIFNNCWLLMEEFDLAHRCRALASSFARGGVGGVRPARSDMALYQFGSE
jgi:hypothetical protein